jgi:hypothetical protein
MNVVTHIKTYQPSPDVIIERAYCRNWLDSVMTHSVRCPFPAWSLRLLNRGSPVKIAH